MAILRVDHKTVYRYANPVSFGDHRLMFRPRDSHDLRLIDTSLTISPAATVRWLHDVFGNSIPIASFHEPAAVLSFDSSFRAEHFPTESQELVLEPYAQRYPFSYSAEDIPDLGRSIERHYPDPDHQIDAWARWFIEGDRSLDTMDILVGMTRSIKHQFSYSRRDEMGTQEPIVTLETRSGSCRDFALFMMEAARSLGFAAHFVSGCLHDEKLV